MKLNLSGKWKIIDKKMLLKKKKPITFDCDSFIHYRKVISTRMSQLKHFLVCHCSILTNEMNTLGNFHEPYE